MCDRFYFRLDGLGVGYDGKTIVKDTSFSVEKGEIISLIGPNGVGKTTILKSMIKQLKPMSGKVLFLDNSVYEIPDKELSKQMSVVLTTPLKTEMTTVREVVETGRYPYTGRFGVLSQEDKKIVDEVMALIRVLDIEEHDFMKISDGQKQRVMLARALAQQPEILVLDEPTSYLDIKNKMEFLSILKRLSHEQGLTVIMSLHEVEMAKIISDKIACFKEGKLDKFGTPEDIFKDNYILKLYGVEMEYLSEEFQKMILEM